MLKINENFIVICWDFAPNIPNGGSTSTRRLNGVPVVFLESVYGIPALLVRPKVECSTSRKHTFWYSLRHLSPDFQLRMQQ